MTENESGSGSLLARIRAEREAHMADRHLDLPVPTWGGRLIARYRVIDKKEWKRLSRADVDDRDLIAAACIGLFVNDGGDMQPIEDNGAPVVFDSVFAEMNDQRLSDSRSVVSWAFGGEDLAVGAVARKLIDWMADTSAEVDGALGEA